jgi:Tfp pilus assembly protein PilO
MEEGKTEDIKSKDQSKKRVLFIFLYRYFNYLIIFIVLIILLVGFLYLIKPKYTSITRGVEQINKEREELRDDLSNYLNDLNSYKKQYSQVSDTEKEKINKMLPDNEVAEDLFAHMESLISRRGLILDSMKVGSEKDKRGKKTKSAAKSDKDSLGQINIINMEVSVSGVDYKGLKDLLNTIENNLRIMDIKEITSSPEENTVTLKIDTYSYK